MTENKVAAGRLNAPNTFGYNHTEFPNLLHSFRVHHFSKRNTENASHKKKNRLINLM